MLPYAMRPFFSRIRPLLETNTPSNGISRVAVVCAWRNISPGRRGWCLYSHMDPLYAPCFLHAIRIELGLILRSRPASPAHRHSLTVPVTLSVCTTVLALDVVFGNTRFSHCIALSAQRRLCGKSFVGSRSIWSTSGWPSGLGIKASATRRYTRRPTCLFFLIVRPTVKRPPSLNCFKM